VHYYETTCWCGVECYFCNLSIGTTKQQTTKTIYPIERNIKPITGVPPPSEQRHSDSNPLFYSILERLTSLKQSERF